MTRKRKRLAYLRAGPKYSEDIDTPSRQQIHMTPSIPCTHTETCLHGKRDLLTWQQRPTYMAKETYYQHPLHAYRVHA